MESLRSDQWWACCKDARKLIAQQIESGELTVAQASSLAQRVNELQREGLTEKSKLCRERLPIS